MGRVYAVDDFGAIRARMAEIRHERSDAPASKGATEIEQRPLRIHTAPGKRMLKDLAFARRFRVGSKIVLSL